MNREKKVCGSGFRVQLKPIAVGLMLAVFANLASATELQWRKVGPKRFSPSGYSQPISKAADSSKTSPPTRPTARRDGAVRKVAFEEDARQIFEGPSFDAQQAAGSSDRSVVVDQADTVEASPSRTVRSAQLDFRPPTDSNGRYGEQMFDSEEPHEQPLFEEESSEMELEEEMPLPPESIPPDDATQPEDDFRQPGAQQRQPPRTFQPAPPRDRPRPDPFVESDLEPDAGLPPIDDPSLADEGSEAQVDCDQEFRRLKEHTLNQVSLDIAIVGNPGRDFPFECSIDDGTWHTGRYWNEITYMWKASALCHKPLYFENESLERYGHSWGPYVDPLVSGAHFFVTLPVLPYCMGVTPPNECMYTLGHYRPGSCAPYTINPVPISLRGAMLEAGAVVGTAAILP